MGYEQRETQNHSTVVRNQIQPFFIDSNDYKLKKISACIRFHAELIHLLNFRQPLSTKELLSELGVSKQKLLRDLKQLQRHDLVVRISFESHVLYVINGNFNTVIRSVLNL